MATEKLPHPLRDSSDAAINDDSRFNDIGGPPAHQTSEGEGVRLPGRVDKPVQDGDQEDEAKAAINDDFRFPTAGGPSDPSVGVGLGQRLPGRATQQISTSPYATDDAATGSYIDDLNFPTANGPREWVYPNVGRGVRLPGSPVVDVVNISSQTITARGDISDLSYWILREQSTFVTDKNDGDGKEYLYGDNYRMAFLYDANAAQDDWHTHANEYCGCGRDGYWYYKGQKADTTNLSLGTLAGGKNHQAWNYVNDVEDLPIRHGSADVTMTITGDDELHIYTNTPVTGWQSQYVWSAGRWQLVGDFTFEISWKDLSVTGGSSGGWFIEFRHDPAYRWYMQRQTSGNWNTRVMNNNAWATNDNWTSNCVTGKFKFSRTGSVWKVEGYNGDTDTWYTFRSAYSWISNPVEVHFGVQGDGGRSVDVKAYGVVVTGGIDNRASWALEGSGTHRGAKTEFPEKALICSTDLSIDIIDVEEDKLWMRFIQGTNYAIPTYAGWPTYCRFKNGMLVFGMDENDADGMMVIVDYQVDQIRSLRTVGSAYTGALKVINAYTDVAWGYTSGDGVIRERHNGDLHYTGDYDYWQSPGISIEDADIYFPTKDYVYYFTASEGGISIHRQSTKHDHKATAASGDSPTYPFRTKSTETGKMYRVFVIDSTGRIYYTDRTNIYYAELSNWQATLAEGSTGGTFTADGSKTFPTASIGMYYGSQYNYACTSTKIYVAADEGVYVSNPFPSGAWELIYGVPGSGATHEILPAGVRMVSVNFSTHGSQDLLYVGSELGGIIVIDTTDHSVYGRSSLSSKLQHNRWTDADSVDLYRTHVAGIDRETISAGQGAELATIASVDLLKTGLLRVTYAQPMLFDHDYGKVDWTTSYTIVNQTAGGELMIIRARKISDTVVDLDTLDHEEGDIYRITVNTDVWDVYGNEMDPTQNYAEYVGKQIVGTDATAFFSFWSQYTGFQQQFNDVEKPYLIDQSPVPDSLLQDPEGDLYFTIYDDIAGVNLDSVKIWVDGTLVYEDQRTATDYWVIVNEVDDGQGYRFRVIIENAGGMTPEAAVPIRVYAEDKAPLANRMDETYIINTDKRLSKTEPSRTISVAEDVVMFEWDLDLSTGMDYASTDSYTLTPIDSSDSVQLVQVLPQYGKSTSYIFLRIKGLRRGERYRLDILRDRVFDIDGRMLRGKSAVWTQRRTKVDSVVGSLAEMYNVKDRTVLRSILESISLRDEDIGGDF